MPCPRDIEKGLEAGFFRYLTKPIKVNEFMDTLDVALESAENGGSLPQMTQEMIRMNNPRLKNS